MADFNRTDDRLTTADFAGRRAADASVSEDPRLRAQHDAELRDRETELTGGLQGDYANLNRDDDFRRNDLLDREDPLASSRGDLAADRGNALRSDAGFRSGTVTDNASGYATQASPAYGNEGNLRGESPGANSLLSDSDIGDLRSRWSDIQAEFVDEPRRSVEKADELVASAMQRLAEGFANERASLEKQWDSGSNVSTEDLRIALQRYRAFFGRLINAA